MFLYETVTYRFIYTYKLLHPMCYSVKQLATRKLENARKVSSNLLCITSPNNFITAAITSTRTFMRVFIRCFDI